VNHLDRTTLLARRESLQRQLQTYYKTLGHLEEQQARYGLRTPVDLLHDLELVRDNIERVETELAGITARLDSLPAGVEPGEVGPAAGVSLPPASAVPAAELVPLVEALDRRSLALFIGADLPVEVTGLPSRADLAADLARRKGLSGSLSLAEVSQRVSQAGNRFEFTDFLRAALDTVGKSPRPFHQAVAALLKSGRLETVITTAYDALLELACQQAGLALNRVIRGGDVRFVSPDRPTLLKLYGDTQQPDTLVVTDRDHSDLLRSREREELVDEVKRVFRRNTVLFLGYDLADPDFRFLFDQVAESRFARTAYAVWPSLPFTDVEMWRDRGIVILPAEAVAVVSALAGG
jgi:hypothetical protein